MCYWQTSLFGFCFGDHLCGPVAQVNTYTPLLVLDSKDGSFHQKPKWGVNAQVQREPLTLVGRGHSSKSRVITAGPSGSSSGITRMRDCTTSNQPSSEENQVWLSDGSLVQTHGHRHKPGISPNNRDEPSRVRVPYPSLPSRGE